MNEEPTFDQATAALADYLNGPNRNALLAFCRVLAGAPWVTEARVLAIDAEGLDIAMSDGNGRAETGRVAFSRPAENPGELRWLLMELADRADPPDGLIRAAARVATPKAGRYLKALVNHFNHKANAGYDGNSGHVTFPFGQCEMTAEDDALLLHVSADTETKFQRVQEVVASHLARFAQKEELHVEWEIRKTSN